MNLHASIRGLALAVGGLLVLAGVALATGGNGADDASASSNSTSISPSPSAFETAGGALTSPEPTASPEGVALRRRPLPRRRVFPDRVPDRLGGRRRISGSIPGRFPSCLGRSRCVAVRVPRR